MDQKKLFELRDNSSYTTSSYAEFTVQVIQNYSCVYADITTQVYQTTTSQSMKRDEPPGAVCFSASRRQTQI